MLLLSKMLSRNETWLLGPVVMCGVLCMARYEIIYWLFIVQMILAEKAEALREEADSLSTVPTDN